jgi:hypothetical protein
MFFLGNDARNACRYSLYASKELCKRTKKIYVVALHWAVFQDTIIYFIRSKGK